jgi:radical SAM protein with 4Fe4S-binding SPASM domain
MSIHSAEITPGPAGKAGELRNRLWDTAYEQCIPLGATIELSLDCNLRCLHCYNFDRSLDAAPEPQAPPLTRAEVLDIIDQLADAGCLYLSFTGGESMMHRHLLDFVRHARERRFAVKLKTNGTLLTARTIPKLLESGVLGVDVSIYGATAETHDTFTVRPGSFARTVEGIQAAKQAGLDVTVNISLMHSNVHEVQHMLDLTSQWGVGLGVSPFITARYDGSTDSRDLAPSREWLERLYRGPLRHLLGTPDFDPKRSVQCACARSNVAITASGEVYPCIGAPVACGNLRQQRFRDIWLNSPQLNRIRELTLEDFKSCEPCPDRPFCHRNSGVVYTNTGDYTGPEPFTCMDAGVVRLIYEESHDEQ